MLHLACSPQRKLDTSQNNSYALLSQPNKWEKGNDCRLRQQITPTCASSRKTLPLKYRIGTLVQSLTLLVCNCPIESQWNRYNPELFVTVQLSWCKKDKYKACFSGIRNLKRYPCALHVNKDGLEVKFRSDIFVNQVHQNMTKRNARVLIFSWSLLWRREYKQHIFGLWKHSCSLQVMLISC